MVHHSGLGAHWDALLILGLWAVVGAVLAVRGFSWEARRER
jgi:ABC-2 type transport system permease protein